MGIKWIWIAAAAAAAIALSVAALRRKRGAEGSACGDTKQNKPFEPRPESEPTAAGPNATDRPDPKPQPPAATRAPEPAAEKILSAAPAEPEAPSEAPCTDDRPTILVAEDNPSNYKLVEVLLRNDYRLVHAENGQEAVELYALHRPSVVLMDISMPVMDGYDALKAIRASDPEARVVALTAYAFEADRQRMMQSGFDACLAKPLDVHELRRLIRSELTKPHA